MNRLEQCDQPTITLVNVPPTEHNELNGTLSKDVYTRARIPTAGLGIIEGALLDQGYEDVKTIDPRFHDDYGKFTDLDRERLRHSKIVGITSMTRNRSASLKFIGELKKHNPNAIIIAGGFDPTFKPEKWLQGEKSADYVVRKEGEKTIVELLQVLRNNGPIENVKGINYKRDGEIIGSVDRPLLTEAELAKTAIPHFPDYILRNSTTSAVIGSRGCLGNCNFCSVRGFHEGKWRIEPTEKVLKQIRNNTKPGGKVFFVDDNFAPKHRLEEVKEIMQSIIDNGLHDRNYFLQLDTVTVNHDPEFIKLCRKMGVFGVFLGIESMDSNVLKGMHKPATVEQNWKAIKKFLDKRIYVHAMTIAGSDRDTYKSIEATIRWLIKSGVNSIQIFAETPIPGSQLGERKLILPRAEEDTNLIDGQHVVTESPDGMTCCGLQQKIYDMYREFYSIHHIANSFRPLRGITHDPERAIKLIIANLVVWAYARGIISSVAESSYGKGYSDYLRKIDRNIHDQNITEATDGWNAFWEGREPTEETTPQEITIFDANK